MSWQSYVNDNLLGTKKILKAAIFGHDKATWATSPDFNVQPKELDTLMQAFKDPSGIRASGLRLADQKYIALNCNDRSIYAKQGSGGIICVKTKQTVMLGTYDGTIQPGEAVKVMEGLADYLISVNYRVIGDAQIKELDGKGVEGRGAIHFLLLNGKNIELNE